MSLRFVAITISAVLGFAACRDESPSPLTQRAYVWQRDWTPAVRDAVKSADSTKLDALILFGAEVVWDHGKPKPVWCSIDWPVVRALHKPVSIALRIAPFGGPFAENDEVARSLADIAKSLLAKLRDERVACAEFQLDFDCAQKKLAGYVLWLKTVRAAVKPQRFVITTLPSWLEEAEFDHVIRQADGYVLQVHSVPPSRPAAHAFVCEPDRARRWVTRANQLGQPFEVALSTYCAVVGYDDAGRLRGVALDGVQPSWPVGTRLMQLDSDAEAMASLVKDWRKDRPSHLSGVIWYRLPVATDQRNWRASTFASVVAGQPLKHHLTPHFTDDNPADLSLVNEGDLDEDFAGKVIVRWKGDAPEASDALRGWSLRVDDGLAEFTRVQVLRLPPGASRSIGWLRFHQRALLHVEVIR